MFAENLCFCSSLETIVLNLGRSAPVFDLSILWLCFSKLKLELCMFGWMCGSQRTRSRGVCSRSGTEGAKQSGNKQVLRH